MNTDDAARRLGKREQQGPLSRLAAIGFAAQALGALLLLLRPDRSADRNRHRSRAHTLDTQRRFAGMGFPGSCFPGGVTCLNNRPARASSEMTVELQAHLRLPERPQLHSVDSRCAVPVGDLSDQRLACRHIF